MCYSIGGPVNFIIYEKEISNMVMKKFILILCTLFFLGVYSSYAFNSSDLKTVSDLKKCPNCDLSAAYLVNLSAPEADFSNANLQRANLTNASLRGANMTNANLSGANLSKASLRGSDLSNANMTGARLIDAWLNDTNLSDANLTNANLSHANLAGAILSNTKLNGARLDEAIWIDGTKCKEGSVGGCKK
jgi:uncharacterized protein YjbI with pentapeptide repeats